ARRLIEYPLVGGEILDHPLLGKGLGATYELPGIAIIGGPAGEIVDYHYIHNLFLLIAFRLGVPALLCCIFLLGKLFRASLRSYRHGSAAAGADSALHAALIAAVAGHVALSMTSPTFLWHPSAGILGCILALTL